MNQQQIRNFCIIAHIDHGKSTLADRLLELTGTVPKREMREQLLDTMELERERGITIKLAPVRMIYEVKNSKSEARNPKQILNNKFRTSLEIRNSDLGFEDSIYILNLIDTPGHVDFSYEVSRSLAAVEGALLVVDATQGIQAQTLSVAQAARDLGLVLIPVINKIDLPHANSEKVADELASVFGFKKEEILFISAKLGTNVEQVLEAIIKKIPPPKGEKKAPLRALIFDANFDPYQGVVAFIRIFDGILEVGQEIFLMRQNILAESLELGYLTPQPVSSPEIQTGEIGFIKTGVKKIKEVPVGETITYASNRAVNPLPGYKKIQPMVFAGFYPSDGGAAPILREALEKLQLNDAALSFTPESSPMLGFGFRCGFLGVLHLEIVKERLEREFNLEIIVTTPQVAYEIIANNDEKIIIDSPTKLPESSSYKEILEPWIKIEILTPSEYLGSIFSLMERFRGAIKDTQYLEGKRVVLIFEMPLSSLVANFYDALKSITSGYASASYEFLEFRKGDLVRLDVLVGGDKIDAFSQIVPKSEVYEVGKRVVGKLKELIPRQLVELPIQAAVGAKIIARETVRALRKDVTGYLYGGDVTRKRKLLEKQKKGKKKMKVFGKARIPAEVFLKYLKQ